MERAIIAAAHPKGASKDFVQQRLNELDGLVTAAGGLVVGQFVQARDNPQSGLGSGAQAELGLLLVELEASLVVFEGELSAGTLNAMQKAVGSAARVVDRTQIILDIFARRARTREGRVQVELAQYRYLEPRLKGRQGYSRQGGGIGTRGPGETRLELDRRLIRKRIRELSSELEAIETQRSGRRQRRRRTEVPLVALAGYTNVGKSTLFSAMTNRPQEAADALFVTLDSTVRRMLVPGFGPSLVADTVGFVDRLPHELVAAFRSTLAEIRDADVIVDVVSANPRFPVTVAEQIRVIRETTRDLGGPSVPHVLAYSQWDLLGTSTAPVLQPGELAVSGLTGDGLGSLKGALASQLGRLYRQQRLQLGWNEADAWKVIYREFQVLSQNDLSYGAELTVRGPERAFFLLDQARRAGLRPST